MCHPASGPLDLPRRARPRDYRDQVLEALDQAIENTTVGDGWACARDVVRQLRPIGEPSIGDICSVGTALAWLRREGLVEYAGGTNPPRLWTVTGAGDDRLYELARAAA